MSARGSLLRASRGTLCLGRERIRFGFLRKQSLPEDKNTQQYAPTKQARVPRYCYAHFTFSFAKESHRTLQYFKLACTILLMATSQIKKTHATTSPAA